MDDAAYMEMALRMARKALRFGEVPVGAVIVRDETVIAQAHNLTRTDRDPPAHAETVAIRRAAAHLEDWRLSGCTLYCTVEPCILCAGAILLARIDRLVYGCPDPKMGA
ncbi:MAG: tRNA-specific adenosine deaminase, partial [Deltaproteobacteria bacterium]